MDTDSQAPDLPCVVKPRANATAEQLKDLGTALAAWSDREAGEGGLLKFIDHLALIDLMGAGEPQDVVAEILGWPSSPTLPEGAATLPGAAPLPALTAAPEELFVFFVLHGGPAFSRRRAVESLRAALPADLVEDVLIDRRSWDVVE
jgi:hypothetical protein